jgi:hypothetical protein
METSLIGDAVRLWWTQRKPTGSESLAEMKPSTSWFRLQKQQLPQGARGLRDDLYPIKVASVKKAAVLDEYDEIRVGVAPASSQENETTVAKIAWHSRKDSAKAYGSMVVDLTNTILQLPRDRTCIPMQQHP